MASWVPPPRELPPAAPLGTTDPHGDLVRLGGHVVADRDAVVLAERLAELEDDLARRAAREHPENRGLALICRLARDRLARDLELLNAALERSRLTAH
jgi:hypothetical protein